MNSSLHPIQEIIAHKRGALTRDAMRYWVAKYGYSGVLLDAMDRLKVQFNVLYKTGDCAQRKLGQVEILYLDVSNTVAAALGKRNQIIINPFYLIYDPDYVTHIALAHEMAHIMRFNLTTGNDRNSHDDVWKSYCKELVGHELPQVHDLPSKELVKQHLEEKGSISIEDFAFLKENY